MAGSTRSNRHWGWTAAVRRSVLVGFVVAALVWGTHLDARNDSEPPAFLVIEPHLLTKLQLLADGLHTEIVLCLHGTTEGDTIRANDFSMPEPRFSASNSSAALPCPPETLAVWHNHPWVELRALKEAPHTLQMRRVPAYQPLDLCILSEQDIQTATRVEYPFVVVAVDAETWCWWTLEQVQQFARDGVTRGRSWAGQALSGSRSEGPPLRTPASAP